MIDAITEGKRYTLNVDGDELNQSSASFDFLQDGRIAIGVTVPGLFAFIDNPRTAREIAGALVAWANRKDPSANRELKPTTSIPEETIKRQQSVYEQIPQPDSKEIWYLRTVGNMTPETKNRNLRDLLRIYNDLHPNSEEAVDTQKAIQILLDNGAQ